VRSGFWHTEYFGRLFPGGDHDHTWLLTSRELKRLDRFGGSISIKLAIDADYFVSIDGTLSGWAIHREFNTADKAPWRDILQVQFLNDQGVLADPIDIPSCRNVASVTIAYLWITCDSSIVRISREGKVDHFSDSKFFETVRTFDEGRGAWIIGFSDIKHVDPEAPDPRQRSRDFPLTEDLLFLRPIGHSDDGRFLWLADQAREAQQRLFLLDMKGAEEQWKRPIAKLDTKEAKEQREWPIARYYEGFYVNGDFGADEGFQTNFQTTSDGGAVWAPGYHFTMDGNHVSLPDDLDLIRIANRGDRAWFRDKSSDIFLLTFMDNGTWQRRKVSDTQFYDFGSLDIGWNIVWNIFDAGQPGLWTRCNRHICLVDSDGNTIVYHDPELLQFAPANRDLFDPVDRIDAAPDGRHAVVRERRIHEPNHLWLLGVDDPVDLGKTPFDYTAKSIQVARDGRHFWLAPSSDRPRTSFIASYLVETPVYLYGTTDDVTVRVSLDQYPVEPGATTTVRMRRGEARPSVAVTWAGGGQPPPFKMELVLLAHGRVVASTTPLVPAGSPGATGVSTVDRHFEPLQWAEGVDSDGPFVVELRLQDPFGDEMTFLTGEVRFAVPILDLPWVRSLLLYAALLVLAAVLLVVFRPSFPRMSRALPSLVAALGAGAGAVGPKLNHALDLHLDATVLLGLLGGTLGACLIAGVVSAGAFRLIVETEPFHAMAPLLLTVPRVRRRLYLDYLRKRVEEPLRHARRAANDEHYSVVPVRVLSRAEADGAPVGVLDDPAVQICALVASRDVDARWDVLIESPGGRGKSALVREVVQHAADEFCRRRGAPLPLLIETSDGKRSFDELVTAAVKDCLVASTTVTARLRAGDFFVVVDGLSESSLAPDAVREFVRRDDIAVRALFATRPHDRYRAALEAADRFVIVEPLSLDASTLPHFVEAYRDGGAGLSDRLQAICRGRDGSYLPILVRLALLVGGENADSVAAVYQQAFLRLLGRREAMDEGAAQRALDEAAQLCLATFWPDGHRGIAYADAAAARVELLDRLVAAGVLVSAGAVPRTGRPRELRFFHDSMQSYLTARALFAKDDWKALARAAGAPEFQGGSDAAGRQSSEVFQMCLQVFAPDERLAAALRGDLEAWARDHGGDLARNVVLAAIMEGMRGDVEAALDPALGGGAVLQEVVRRSDVGAATERVHRLGALYSAVAPLVWPLRGRTPPVAVPVEPQTTAA
jgi:hypothetical protein